MHQICGQVLRAGKEGYFEIGKYLPIRDLMVTRRPGSSVRTCDFVLPSILRLLKVRVSSSGVKNVTDGQDALPRASLFDDQTQRRSEFHSLG